MGAFWKAAAIVILTVILGATISKTEKDIALVLSAAACCFVALTAMEYLSEVVAFLWELGSLSETGGSLLNPLLKIAGVAILTELTSMISADAGNASLGKAMQILGNTVILVLSIPILNAFLAIIQEMLRFS